MSIDNSRIEIEYIREEKPSINQEYILSIWKRLFNDALRLASKEASIKGIELKMLDWQQVFEEDYSL
jgi:hypothetical protein